MKKNIINDPALVTLTMPNIEGIPDDLLDDAVKVITQFDRASASLIQRRLGVGYARAAKIIDQLEKAGAIGQPEGDSHSRRVLIKYEDWDKVAKPQEEKKKEPDILYNYISPNLSIVQKPKDNPWKKSLYDAVNEKSFKEAGEFSFPIGYTDDNKLVMKSLKDLNHLIIGGNSVSNKEVVLDSILTSLILKESHQNLSLILIDSTRYLNFYNNLQHLLSPVMDRAVSALRWMISESDRRIKLFIQEQERDIESYNSKSKVKFPHILLVINQMEDLMQYYPVEIGDHIARLLIISRRVGFHIIFTTNFLTTKAIPSNIQSEIPNKLFFKFTSSHDAGPKKVHEVESLKPGEAIFISDSKDEPTKINSIYTSDENVKDIVREIISHK